MSIISSSFMPRVKEWRKPESSACGVRAGCARELRCRPDSPAAFEREQKPIFHPQQKMMTQDMRDLIARSPYTHATVREVAAMLPDEDSVLDALIGDAVARCEDIEFVVAAMAALLLERPVQALHLARGAMLLGDRWTLGAFACHMQGDVAGALMAAVTETPLPHPVLASAIYLAVRFHLDQKSGMRLPGTLLTHARKAARDPQNTNYEKTLLFAVATLCGDPGLTELVLHHDGGKKPDDPRVKDWEEGAKTLGEQMLAIWRQPPADILPKEQRRTVAEGNTMRRAVARVGRNEKCPCGSGKKYKQCCMEKDAELLQHSTSIAGVTAMELRANPERYLTSQDMNETAALEAARFDPRKIAPELRVNYLACLCRGKIFERCVEAMEVFGYSAELEEAWDNISLRIAQARRKDLLDRLMKLRPDASESNNQGLQLFLNEDNPAKLHEVATGGALMYLQDEKDPVEMMGYARALMQSSLCAVGILVTRGLLPLLPREHASQLLGEMLEARDKLNLGPVDPISDVLDQPFLEQRSGTGKEAAALREVQQRLNDKLQEMRRYRENVERLEKELARREQLAAPPPPAAPAAAVPLRHLLRMKPRCRNCGRRSANCARRLLSGITSAMRCGANCRRRTRRSIRCGKRPRRPRRRTRRRTTRRICCCRRRRRAASPFGRLNFPRTSGRRLPACRNPWRAER